MLGSDFDFQIIRQCYQDYGRGVVLVYSQVHLNLKYIDIDSCSMFPVQIYIAAAAAYKEYDPGKQFLLITEELLEAKSKYSFSIVSYSVDTQSLSDH